MYKYHDEKGQHLHELSGKPLIGTSTVIGVLMKTLTWWASSLACAEFGWIKAADKIKATEEEITANGIARQKSALSMLEKFSAMTPDEYIALTDKAYKAHSVKLDKAADKGTDMHAELEKYIKACVEKDGKPTKIAVGSFVPQVHIFVEWAMTNVKRFIASEAHCYSEKLWTGGICDAIAELNDGKLAIIDFKSAKEAYDSHFIQCAGYAIEAEENGLFDADGKLIAKLEKPIDVFIVFPFGAEKVEPAMKYDTEGYKRCFESCVQLYKFLNQNK